MGNSSFWRCTQNIVYFYTMFGVFAMFSEATWLGCEADTILVSSQIMMQ